MEKIFTRVTFLMCIFLLAFVIFCPSDTFLESENRRVQKLEFDDVVFAERLPLRTPLMRLNRDVFLALGKNEFAGAILGSDGYIFSNESVSSDTLLKNLAFADELSQETPTHLCVIPSKTDALITKLPRFYESGRSELWKILSENRLNAEDVLPTLLLAANNSKYVYYRGDHHLTSLGSYYVYKSLATSLGITPYGADDFFVGVVKSDFSGSDARKMLVNSGDKISLFRYKGDTLFLTKNLDSGESFYGFYNHDKLLTNDPYGIFPVPDCGHARITLGEGRKRLLLVCDSYGDSLCPFLARHFDLDIIDPRYYSGSIKQLINENNYTAALLCFGMDTIASKEILYKLKF